MAEKNGCHFSPEKYFYQNYEITLNCGRRIWLANPNQYQTYAGALEGIPW